MEAAFLLLAAPSFFDKAPTPFAMVKTGIIVLAAGFDMAAFKMSFGFRSLHEENYSVKPGSCMLRWDGYYCVIR